MDLFGVGPATTARILSDVAEVARFPDPNHFASWTGTASIDASSAGTDSMRTLKLTGMIEGIDARPAQARAGKISGPAVAS
jgi:transposase